MADLEVLGIELVQLDVTDASSVKAARDLVQSRSPDGSLDILANCAGVAGSPCPAVDLDLEATKQVYAINVFGAMRMVQEFLPLLLKSRQASIWNIGSVAGNISMPFASTYGSSKAALHSYSDTLRLGQLIRPVLLMLENSRLTVDLRNQNWLPSSELCTCAILPRPCF